MPAPPPADPALRPGFLLRRAHQVAVAIFADEVGGLGLTPPQHNALSAIAARPGLHQSALAAAVGYDRATIGALVAGLAAKKLVKRVRSAEDARVWSLQLTARGERLLRTVAGAMERINERIVAPLAPAERRAFVTLLGKVAAALPRSAAGADRASQAPATEQQARAEPPARRAAAKRRP